jgi:hypothetical protein
MSYYVCECGEQFEKDQQGAREHMLEQHLDLIDSRFEEFLDEARDSDDAGEDERTDDEIYDEAIDDVTDELLDLFEEN